MNYKMLVLSTLAVFTAVGCSAKNIIDAKTQAEVQQAIDGNSMVIVDYHAESYCAPCKQMAKLLPDIAQEFSSIQFVKADINKEGVGSDIQSVPTFVFFKNGKEVMRFTGSKTKASFSNIIREVFKCCDTKKK